MIKQEEVLDVIQAERGYQDEKWGGSVHDANESIGNFLLYIERYLDKAKGAYVDASETFREPTLHEVRKIAALAVACMEVHGSPGREGR